MTFERLFVCMPFKSKDNYKVEYLILLLHIFFYDTFIRYSFIKDLMKLRRGNH